MPRVVRSQPPARLRQACLRNIRAAIQRCGDPTTSWDDERQRLAYIIDQLSLIAGSIEETALAWEKRGYWARADAFRRQWDWVETSRQGLQVSLDSQVAVDSDPILGTVLVRLIQLGVPLPDSRPARRTKRRQA